MKKKLLLSCMTAAMIVGLVPQANTTVQANNNYQGSAFEQGDYDTEAEFPYGENWSENSPYAVSKKKETKWQFSFGDVTYAGGRAAIGKDGVSYVVGHKRATLYAVNSDGTLKWKKEGKFFFGVPVIGKDGTIYVASGVPDKSGHYHSLEAYNPDGTLKWEAKSSKSGDAHLAIDKDGTIYMAGTKTLEAFSSDGVLKWGKTLERGGGGPNKILISKTGLIHVLFVSSTDSAKASLYTYDKNGMEKWNKEMRSQKYGSSFTLASNGDIYYSGDKAILIISPNGELKGEWRTEQEITGSPTISDKDGTVYVNTRFNLLAYNPDGTLKWSTRTATQGAPLLDANGLIYLLTSGNYLVIVNPDGTLESRTLLNGVRQNISPHSQLSIGKDGTLYAVGYGVDEKYKRHGSITAIGDPNPPDTLCPKPEDYLQTIKDLIKTNDLTEEQKKEAREKLTKERDELNEVLKSLE